MADALLILTKHNPSAALHAHEEQTAQTSTASTEPQSASELMAPNQAVPCEGSSTKRASSRTPITKPKLHVASTPPSKPNNVVIDYDEDPFPHPENKSEDRDRWSTNEQSASCSTGAADETPDHEEPPEGLSNMHTGESRVIVQRADTRLIIHWNAATGSVNFENSPPVDHPRLQAILCDAQIDIQHCEHNGLPTGLVTTAHHANYRQERYPCLP
jgi:hypothetical protein